MPSKAAGIEKGRFLASLRTDFEKDLIEAMRRSFWKSWRACALLLLTGCGFHPPGPPWEYPTTSVSGRVSVGGEPVRGWISFHPMGGTVGDHVIVPVGETGEFVADHCPVGRLGVRMAIPRVELDRLAELSRRHPLWGRLLAAHLPRVSGPSSELHFQSFAEKKNRLQLDLLRSPGLLHNLDEDRN